jgi:predicted RNA polymerase sigma factor
MTTIAELKAEKEKLEQEDWELLDALWASVASWGKSLVEASGVQVGDSVDPTPSLTVLEAFQPRLKAQRQVWESFANLVIQFQPQNYKDGAEAEALYQHCLKRLIQQKP